MSEAVKAQTEVAIQNLDLLVAASQTAGAKIEIFESSKTVDLKWGNRPVAVGKIEVVDGAQRFDIAIVEKKGVKGTYELVYDHMFNIVPVKEIGVLYNMHLLAACAEAKSGYQTTKAFAKVNGQWVTEVERA